MRKIILILSLVFILVSVCLSQDTSGNQEKVIIKANTEFNVQLETQISNETNAVGDEVKFILTADLVGDGEVILKGSTIFARIVSVEKLSAKNDTAKLCIMFDFIKHGELFVALSANIISIEPNPDSIKLTNSAMFSGGTTLSSKSKAIQLDKGAIFKVKLMKDMTSN